MGIAFLVDGLTEQKFIQMICVNAPVKRINLNGASVQTAALAKRVATLIRLWGGKYKKIIIIVDREKRAESAEQFHDDLMCALVEEGVNDDVIIGVADRMIENWMLGDASLWGGLALPPVVDGFSGATKIKDMLEGYDKVVNGPELLRRARASAIRQASPSFEAFAKQLRGIRCHWLAR